MIIHIYIFWPSESRAADQTTTSNKQNETHKEMTKHTPEISMHLSNSKRMNTNFYHDFQIIRLHTTATDAH